MANENCLKGYACPECGSEGPFDVEVRAWCTLADDGTDNFHEVEWDPESKCMCKQCKHFGYVGDFCPEEEEEEGTGTPDVDTVVMRCADEELTERTFEANGDTLNDKPDYTCTHCGWSQVSEAGGCAELCLSAVWHDKEEYRKYAAIARTGGYEIPEEPPRFMEWADAFTPEEN